MSRLSLTLAAVVLSLSALVRAEDAPKPDAPKADAPKVEAPAVAPGEFPWKVHDMARPQPPIVTPGTYPTQEVPGKAPSDATVLFDGTDISKWRSGKDPAKWKVENGAMIAGGGELKTADSFGDCQLHVEWTAPTPPKGESQGRGNSGIFLMSRYEIQVLDCFENKTYPDGQATGIYGQYPPQVNASLPPGQWQTYDIVFRAPIFGEDGKLVKPAFATVFHNGVLVQEHRQLTGPTGHYQRPPYSKHGDAPIALQDHGSPVKYRNIWIRKLPPFDDVVPPNVLNQKH